MAGITSKTQIGNTALILLGQPTVNDIDAPGSNHKAAVIGGFYDMARQYTLRAGTWRFALTRANIARDTGIPKHSWNYQYKIPEDVMLLHQVGTDDDPLTVNRDYKIEGGYILTNAEGSLPIVYVGDVTDTSLMPPDFALATASILASFGAPPILQSTDKAAEMLKLHEYYLKMAGTNNALENAPRIINNSRWRDSQRTLQVVR